MLDTSKLQEYLELFRADLVSSQANNAWEAVQWFQKNWNLDAPDLASMLSRCLLKAGVFFSNGKPARKQIQTLAKTHPEQVRKLFQALFVPDQDVPGGVQAFCTGAASLLQEDRENPQPSLQDEETVSVYLHLWDPLQYCVFRMPDVKAVFAALHVFEDLTDLDAADCMPAAFELYREVSAYLNKDPQLLQQMRTLNIGIPAVSGALWDRIARLWNAADDFGRYAQDYDAGIQHQTWVNLLSEGFPLNVLVLLKGLFVSEAGASCAQLSQSYGRTPAFYQTQATFMAQQVARETGHVQPDSVPVQLRPLLLPFRIRRAKAGEPGALWLELREPLREALAHANMEEVPLYENSTPGPVYPPPEPPAPKPQKRYWWLSADPAEKPFSWVRFSKMLPTSLPSGDPVQQRTFACMNAARPGDAVVCFEAGKTQKITALAQVEQSRDDNLSFVRTEPLSHPIPLDALRENSKLLDTVETVCNLKAGMVELTPEAYEEICSLARRSVPEPPRYETYSKEKFLQEVYWPETLYTRLLRLLESKRNVILQGAPGVGKTFAARRLAWSILGEKNPDRIALVQFHETFSYEDFVAGYRPEGDGFALRYGVFYSFCRKAAAHPGEKYFFLIDEINRGSLSRIFGELLMLLEKEYRGTSVTLSADGQPFCVPDNVYLIGMMNTADRSLAMIDYALRRRFSFVDLAPAFRSEGFRAYQESLNSRALDALLQVIQSLNVQIAADRSLGPGFCIGHSYFCGCTACTKEWLTDIVDNDILPTLREYWFDAPETVKEWEGRLRGALA